MPHDAPTIELVATNLQGVLQLSLESRTFVVMKYSASSSRRPVVTESMLLSVEQLLDAVGSRLLQDVQQPVVSGDSSTGLSQVDYYFTHTHIYIPGFIAVLKNP